MASQGTLRSQAYIPAAVPTDPNSMSGFLRGQLQQISQSIQQLQDSTPQVATVAPLNPQAGWMRNAQAPWNPLNVSSGNSGWVWFNGTAWVALTSQ